LKVYRVDTTRAARWSRPALWAWSAALAFGALSWLNGHTGGKLFLDWQGFARILFPLASFFLWLVLAWSLRCDRASTQKNSRFDRFAKIFGLLILLSVPATLYWAADPKIYPPVNPDTGGPTGASLLESTLGIVTVLLILPYGLGRQRRGGGEFIAAAWCLFAMEIALSLSLGRTNASHRQPMQFLGLGSLLPWIFMLPLYFRSYEWPARARLWLNALFFWWGILLASAWTIFLPGLLDRFKFTDGLVGHSHMAMAGFVSSMNIFLLVMLLGETRRIFDSRPAFCAWHAGVLGYIGAMFFAGVIEGGQPAFNFVPGDLRNWIYGFRLICGALMTAVALHWLWRATHSGPAAVVVENSK
jgi:cytochrome c oxidase cbb3-type subunit 1